MHKASRRRVYREYIVRNEVVLRAGDTINEFGWDNKHAGINVLISKVSQLNSTQLLIELTTSTSTFFFFYDKGICSHSF